MSAFLPTSSFRGTITSMTKSKEHVESAKRRAVYNRNFRRARERAFVRLKNDFPELYLQYLNEERTRDEEQGKTWVDLDLDSGLPVRIGAADQQPTQETKRSYQNQGNDGGEA